MPVKINYRKCKACKTCYNDCPGDVIGWDEDNNIPFVAYKDECWYCGNCDIHCPEQAIEVSIPPKFF